jgi:hypothetical protein
MGAKMQIDNLLKELEHIWYIPKPPQDARFRAPVG